MSIKSFISNWSKNLYYPIINLNNHKMLKWMPDKLFLKLMFRAKMGKKLNLKEPKSFGEKLQWLKLYDRKPIYTMYVDKYKVKEYVASVIGEEYIVPNIGVWDSPEDIDFEELPRQFVIKLNHNSGTGMYICKDKNKADLKKIKDDLYKGLKENYYIQNREWPYKNVPRKIIAEEFLEDEEIGGLNDYKFMCFNGVAKCIFVETNRTDLHTSNINCFNMNWEETSFIKGLPHNDSGVKKPKNYDKMLEFSEKLSAGIPFARIDWHECNGKLYFGEITLFHASGMHKNNPEDWVGEWITLPEKTKNN